VVDLAGLEKGPFASGGTGRLPPLYIYAFPGEMHILIGSFKE